MVMNKRQINKWSRLGREGRGGGTFAYNTFFKFHEITESNNQSIKIHVRWTILQPKILFILLLIQKIKKTDERLDFLKYI